MQPVGLSLTLCVRFKSFRSPKWRRQKVKVYISCVFTLLQNEVLYFLSRGSNASDFRQVAHVINLISNLI